jgi:hypothetical protein
MKKFLFLCAAVILVGCTVHVEDVAVESQVAKTITFDFETNVTRGLSANGSEMTDLFMYDAVDGDYNQSQHLTPAMSTWDSPQMTLGFGSHNLQFVASRGTGAIEDDESHTITWSKPSDTFWASKQIEVSVGGEETVSVVLQRVATRLRVTITDEVPAGTAQIVVTPATWYYGINYATGVVCDPRSEARAIDIPSSYIGKTGMSVSIFGMSDADEWTTDVTIEAKNADGDILGRVVLHDVPFKRNRTTEYSGALFTNSGTFSISIDDEWGESYQSNW